jgi:hypothetical protein
MVRVCGVSRGKYYTTALLGASSPGVIDNTPDFKNDLCATFER